MPIGKVGLNALGKLGSGNNRNNPKSYMDGYIGELMIWTRALSASEISLVETYVSSKWGI